MNLKTLLYLILGVFQLPLLGQEVLDNIQQKLFDAYGLSVQSQTDHFKPIIESLEMAYQKDQNGLINYWIAFAEYRASILHMNAQKDSLSLELLQKGINRLEQIKKPNSEELALQGTMVSLSINFQPDIAAVLSGKAKSLYDKAIKRNDQNLRAYLGVGRSDFYTPKQYGGGYQVESYLKQALTKPDASSEEAHMPDWGRDEAYYYLASFYEREGQLNEAKLYCNQGLKAFPNNYLLQTLKDKLQ